MQIMINTRQCPCRTLNDECDISGYECYKDDICSTLCPLIRNGGVKLPKGHGDLIDRKELQKVINKDECYDQVLDAPTIIEADKTEREGKQ